MDYQTVPIADVSHDRANARKHGEKNLAAIKGSLKQFGQVRPIVVSKQMVCMAGNGTLAAMRTLLAAGDARFQTVKVIVSDLSAAELRAFAIADNRTAELAEWDKDVLASLLEAVREEEPDMLVATGFDTLDLDALLKDVGAELPTEAAYAPVASLPAHRPAPLPPVPAAGTPAAAPALAAGEPEAEETGEEAPEEDGDAGAAPEAPAAGPGTPATTAPAIVVTPVTPPEAFPEVDENIHTDYQCPRCHYAWSGKTGGEKASS